jgi:hypothetical protein
MTRTYTPDDMPVLTEADKIEIWLACQALDQTDPRVRESQRSLLYRLKKEGKIRP